MNNYIHTFTGKAVNPLAPDAEDIDIRDIAHALSLQTRYAGHCREFYSVAEHSVRVSQVCPRKDALYGLLHDAAEAYLSDLPSPIKYADGFEAYREAEGAVMWAICERFGVPGGEPASVRRADALLLNTEARDLFATPAGWADLANVSTVRIRPMLPRPAEMWFLERFRALTRAAA